MTNMKKNFLSILLSFPLILFFTHSAIAQNEESKSDTLRKNAVKIFLDCTSCDMNYTREQISFANFVRDVKEAQVFILITEQRAGSGGLNILLLIRDCKHSKG